MSLVEKNIIDLIEILDSGYIQVRKATIIEKNGIPIATNYERYTLYPGQDVTNEPQKIKDIASVVWTSEIIANFQTNQQNTNR